MGKKLNLEIIEYALIPERIIFLDGLPKEAALRALAEKTGEAPQVKDPAALLAEVLKDNDDLAPPATEGMAFSHIHLDSVSDIVMSAALCRDGIKDWTGRDGGTVNIVIMIACPKHQHQDCLKSIVYFNELLKDKKVFSKLLVSKDNKDAYKIISGRL